MQHPSSSPDQEVGQDLFAWLYARQCHLIDAGRAGDWADTFTTDGEFVSPTYPRPARGRAELVQIAESFAASAGAGEIPRHVLTTLAVERTGAQTAAARAYLQVLITDSRGETRMARVMTVLDELLETEDGWRVRSRHVHRGNP